MTDHLETGRHVFQLLRDILAQVFDRPAARRAGICVWCMHLLHARQVRRQRLLLRRRSQSSSLMLRMTGILPFVGLQIFQVQLELLDLAVELLGLATELQPPQSGDRQLEIFDLGGAVAELLAQVGDHPGLGDDDGIALGDEGLESGEVVGEVGRRELAGSLCRVSEVYKSEAERCVQGDGGASRCPRVASTVAHG